jgi:uncharacterized membrane protein (DUF485 family)
MPPQDPSDLTPESAAPTDIAPLGRGGAKPQHEQTASEDESRDWDGIAADPDFKKLLASKAKFIIPSTIFFLVYYFALPILVGWLPGLMSIKVWGDMNWAYLFALSQFFMAWILAFIYVGVAAGWDKQASVILARFNKR